MQNFNIQFAHLPKHKPVEVRLAGFYG